MTLRKPLFMNPVEGFSEEMAATDSLQLGGLTMTGPIAMGGYAITGMADPSNPQDGATKAYVDAAAAGYHSVAPVAAVSVSNVPVLSGLLTVDGYTLLNNDRVLLTNQTTGTQNGIWVAHAGAWTRPLDFPTGGSAHAVFTLVLNGSNYKATGWVCTSPVGSDVIDTHSLAWVQISSSISYTFSTGLELVGSDARVKKGDGIELVSNSGATNIDLDTNPGLVLNGTSPNKKLAALVDPNGGIQINGASGLAAKLNGTTLQVGASGLSVKGLPSLFEINALPVSANVTAANLDTLVAGSLSNADALHTHAAAAATASSKVENDLPVNEAVLVGDPVYYTNTNNRIGRGDTVDAKAKIIGVARTAQNVVGNTAKVVSIGPASGVLTGAIAGDPYYLATGGGVVNTLPGSAKRVIRCGIAMNGTDLFVGITDFGKKA